MNAVKWKTDKHCIECRKKIRKEIVEEIQEVCKGCKRIFLVEQDKKNRTPRKKHGRWK